MKLHTPEQIAEETLIGADRLIELAEGGYAPCVYLDGRLMFQRVKINSWVRENLIQIQDGRDMVKNFCFIVDAPPAESPPKELLLVENEIKEYEAREYTVMKHPPCIYFLYLENSLKYIGKSIALHLRISQHISSDKMFNRVFYIQMPESHLEEMEKRLIKKFAPEYNIQHLNKRKFK